ncbi:hypothetical protein ACLOJK_004438, partial [Asimina triloba]
MIAASPINVFHRSSFARGTHHDEHHARCPSLPATTSSTLQPRAAPTSITLAALISCCPNHHNGPESNNPGHTSCAHRDDNASACERANASTHAVAVCDAHDRRFTLKAAAKATVPTAT